MTTTQDTRGEILSQQELRQAIVQVCQLLYAKNMIFASDGNVSARWGDDRIVATPSGVPKGLLTPEELVVTDMGGVMIQGMSPRGLVPSAELRLHLEVYRQRPDVRAVVHAHPPITTALSIAGVSLAPCVVPETLVTVGQIVTADYATPSSEQGPRVIHDLIVDHDALVLDRHGAVAVGPTPMKAYMRMEKVENTAQVIHLALSVLERNRRVPPTLPLAEVRKLSALRDEMLGPDRGFLGPDCGRCGACEGL